MEMFRKNVTPFEVLPFSRFHQKGLKFFVLFVWLTSVRLPLEAKGDLFCNSSRTKFKRRKMLILVKLLAKFVIKIYALGSVHEKFGV